MIQNSITITELRDKLTDYIINHPCDANKMIYFDALHINGIVDKYGPNILELI